MKTTTTLTTIGILLATPLAHGQQTLQTLKECRIAVFKLFAQENEVKDVFFLPEHSLMISGGRAANGDKGIYVVSEAQKKVLFFPYPSPQNIPGKGDTEFNWPASLHLPPEFLGTETAQTLKMNYTYSFWGRDRAKDILVTAYDPSGAKASVSGMPPIAYISLGDRLRDAVELKKVKTKDELQMLKPCTSFSTTLPKLIKQREEEIEKEQSPGEQSRPNKGKKVS